MGTERSGTGDGPSLEAHADARVLIVDDQSVNVMLLDRVLRLAGLQDIHGVTDPREAVRRCLEVGADVILLDLHMPHLDGFDVLAALRSALPADAFVPVVVLTGDATTETRDRVLNAGATDFLTKPFDRVEVILRIRNLLQTRSLYTQVQHHNAVLQAHLDAHEENERRLAEERRLVTERIDGALDDAMEMVFQPIADLATGRILGLEALARFGQAPLRPPNEWFEEAATVGRGAVLELAAVRAALAHLDRLPDDAFLSINLSPATALDPAFLSVWDDVPVERVVLELTEHAPIADYEELLATLEVLRARGMRIAVDDAGAGYAGLQHILRLRPDILKLDIALTSGIDVDPARRALSTAMVAFAGEIGAVIVAEGIETSDELDALRGLRVPWGQGYHLARPARLPLASTELGSIHQTV